MFENLLTDEPQQSPVDALLKLLEKENIDLKTDYEMKQIKTLTIAKWFYLLKTKPNNTAIELLNDTLEYYKMLKVSYKRKSRGEVVKAISEMKEALVEGMLSNKNENN